MASPAASEVYIIDASDRYRAIEALWHEIGPLPLDGKTVAVKANFNSDDPFPATTHPDMLEAVLGQVRAAGAGTVRLGERSGMGETRAVLKNRGAVDVAARTGAEVVALDGLPPEGWEAVPPDGLHWERGFLIARLFREADVVVQTCCLKTHRFGGHVSLSLKNPVGAVAKRAPGSGYNYMAELHSSPHQRRMIAEINRSFPCDVAIMDATEGFSTGGPERGGLVAPNVILASTDRIALDAAGIALLRRYGSTLEVMQGRIFAMDPIARAAELGIGVRSAEDLRLVALDSESKDLVLDMRRILDETA
ncbi:MULTISPECIES: DUF362 domain-containing protein [unclassified Methanoculleus]|uniref:DUF362 domain-containing protein n=1 Tax=unclassified Methanoculleus TaxID=2619537 RepID=UPI0025E20034|nr:MULTISPECIES: DUF362 domain-containing protein [unclassified Methanoculleus]MCK9317655.1 DUF362 domain-containing protein [Methanoculleus sp.]MDD2253539.1 DUF362 domain-containing protein [Methanoculleus sp.]MDD2786512.1 DUF362 domain-containing protein [Methanoculleus sp.]MDD3215639.1 DUF362 domain-containing protein [Methanoculleus sp.]MDD4313441.1 DUF362 domain-containing protein [Methanoculleus sp.]